MFTFAANQLNKPTSFVRPSGLQPIGFTPTAGESGYTYYTVGIAPDNDLFKLSDRDLRFGTIKESGGTYGELYVILTFPLPIYLNRLIIRTGQFNGYYNYPQGLVVYRGTTTANPILNSSGSFNLPTANTTFDTLLNPLFDIPSDTFLLRFFNTTGGNYVSVLDVIAYGQPVPSTYLLLDDFTSNPGLLFGRSIPLISGTTPATWISYYPGSTNPTVGGGIVPSLGGSFGVTTATSLPLGTATQHIALKCQFSNVGGAGNYVGVWLRTNQSTNASVGISAFVRANGSVEVVRVDNSSTFTTLNTYTATPIYDAEFTFEVFLTSTTIQINIPEWSYSSPTITNSDHNTNTGIGFQLPPSYPSTYITKITVT